MFGSQKEIRKEKNAKKNNFLIFSFTTNFLKEN